MSGKEMHAGFPYMPNSVPRVKQEMMAQIGITSREELLTAIPEHLRFRGPLNLPQEPLFSELDLKRHMDALLNRSVSCDEAISFLGGGCYNHYVPAICDEINSRSEFLTAYCGDTYSDHGKLQAIFEFTSLMGELLDLDVVSFTTYDGGQAAASSLRMACRITGRRQILLPRTMHPDVLSQIQDYCALACEIDWIESDPQTGQIDIEKLKAKLSDQTAAVFVESPAYNGVIETDIDVISAAAHAVGALSVVSIDPICLGLLESPANQGADIVCGDVQALGIHMQYGGGCAGFIASKDDPIFIQEYPTYFYGITTTAVEGQYGYGRALNERTSHGSRENAKEYFGTAAGLWAITAGVYLALMGPEGMRELGEHLFYKANAAKQRFSAIKGVKAKFTGPSFKEFVLDFKASGQSVAEINAALLTAGIFGGKDLNGKVPGMEHCALYCVTEMTDEADIELAAMVLDGIINRGEVAK